jgi:hypothetical protein
MLPPFGKFPIKEREKYGKALKPNKHFLQNDENKHFKKLQRKILEKASPFLNEKLPSNPPILLRKSQQHFKEHEEANISVTERRIIKPMKQINERW